MSENFVVALTRNKRHLDLKCMITLHTMSAFYPGAGTDFVPPVLFPDIKTWWYMDSQPRSEYGDYTDFYCPTFLNRLDQIAFQCGFQLQTMDQTVRTYYSPSTDQTIHYETNTVFPAAWDPIKHAGTTLVLCGYDIENDGTTILPSSFFVSYPHIITNSITHESVWMNHVSPFHSISMIEYPDDVEYWLTEHNTKETLQKLYSIKDLRCNHDN